MILKYDSKYDEEIKDLLVQLQQYLADIDNEGYNIVGDEYREKYFNKTIEDVKKNDGKILLYKDNDKIVGLIIGIISVILLVGIGSGATSNVTSKVKSLGTGTLTETPVLEWLPSLSHAYMCVI